MHIWQTLKIKVQLLLSRLLIFALMFHNMEISLLKEAELAIYNVIPPQDIFLFRRGEAVAPLLLLMFSPPACANQTCEG